MRKVSSTDYETYSEIMGELLNPISGEGLDADTLKRLYESKLVYLENLRAKCFLEVNGGRESHFTLDDYALILEAIQQTKGHLHDLIMLALNTSLAKRKVV